MVHKLASISAEYTSMNELSENTQHLPPYNPLLPKWMGNCWPIATVLMLPLFIALWYSRPDACIVSWGILLLWGVFNLYAIVMPPLIALSNIIIFLFHK